MAVLIDTSTLVAIERGSPGPPGDLERLGDEEPVLAAISASELLHGVHRAAGAVQRGRREAFVERVIAALRVLPFDLAVARVHARLWADLRSRGDTIGAHDLLIAATALHHGLRLHTLNARDFRRVPGLQIVVWA